MNEEKYFKLAKELKALGLEDGDIKDHNSNTLTSLSREYSNSGLSAVDYLNFRNIRRIRKNVVFFGWVLIIELTAAAIWIAAINL